MNKKVPLVKCKPVAYNDLYFRLTAALVAAHLIVSYGEPETFFELLALPAYYPAIAASFVIALVVVEWVYRLTRYLDRKMPWEIKLQKRLYGQITLGVCLPILLDCILAATYYQYYGTDIITAGYFRYNFAIVVLLVLLLNGYYVVHYMVKLKLRRPPRHIESALSQFKPKDEDYPMLIVMQNGLCISINRSDQINYHNSSLMQFYKKLSPGDYFLINRALIVERSAIARISAGRSRTINLETFSRHYPTIRVSQRNAVAFKEWLERS